MKNKTIYLVQVNEKVSHEAYSTLREAQEFIVRRLGMSVYEEAYEELGYLDISTSHNGKVTNYKIIDVRVA